MLIKRFLNLFSKMAEHGKRTKETTEGSITQK